MCGLVGIAGFLSLKDEATMKRLFMLDFFRGPDSTGLATVKTTGDVLVAKLSSHPIDLFEMPKFKSALNGGTAKAFIGHNRAATRGGVSTFNAHPFHYGSVVGAHNGTLDYKSTSILEEAVGEKYPVDSMALISAIDKLGVKAAIELCETGKDSNTGAWSLVWYDQKDDTLNFLRNEHRPMWFAYSKDFKRIFWASDWKMIANATQMQSVPDELYVDAKGNCYWTTTEDVHYKYSLADLQKGAAKPKPIIRTIKGKEPAPAKTYNPMGDDPFRRNGTQFTDTGASTKMTYHQSGEHQSGPTKQLIHLFGNSGNPLAGYMSEKKFNDIAFYGCSFCNADINYGDAGVTIFERDDIMLCKQCSNSDPKAIEIPTRIHVHQSVISSYK